MKSKIYLIRHGTTEANLSRKFYGSTDLPLSNKGVDHIIELAKAGIYPKADNAILYTSGLLRAEQTFFLIYGCRDHIILPELLEIFKSETTKEFSVMIEGEKRFFEVSTLPLGIHHDKKTRMFKSIRDITEKKKFQEKLITLATTDFLSGLYNREEFLNLAQRELSWANRHNQNLSLLMIDIDHFKNINDTFGHGAGDEVIREMGNMIMTGFRKTDFAGRLGGEEFAVLLKDSSLDEAKGVANKFKEAVSRTKVIYEKQEISFTVSIGVAATGCSINNRNNIKDVLKQADDALYKAKAKGRNCVATVE
jgi:diguanylate cyclase (GGDEF)-like protein